jgi:hypothetical protein
MYSFTFSLFALLEVDDKPIVAQEVLAGGRFYVTKQRKI